MAANSARSTEIPPSACQAFIEASQAVQAVDGIHDLCSRICDAAGFDFFIYGAEFPVSLVRPQMVAVSGYPPAWWQRYCERGYIAIDPVARHTTTRCTTPLIWNDIDPGRAPQPERVHAFMDEARDFGLVSGVSFPVQGQVGESALLSLVSRDPHARASDRIIGALPAGQLLAAYVHEAARRVFGQTKVLLERTELTPRERECLLWAAEGKTAVDTAQILSISECTVNFHLQNAARKLNVHNRAQAVARAVAQGYVTPQFRP